jgi:hypothetical protein
MVWGFSNEPKGSSYPNKEIVEGMKDGPVVVDQTPDGGAKLTTLPNEAGRRVYPDSLPKVIRWKSNTKLQDLESAVNIKSVSIRLRDLIEEIEPGVHQFEPVKYTNKRKEVIEERWCWVICNRLDTVDRDKTNMVLKANALGITRWRDEGVFQPRIVFSVEAIRHAKFWYDRYLTGSALISDDAKDRIEAARMTGFRFTRAKESADWDSLYAK